MTLPTLALYFNIRELHLHPLSKYLYMFQFARLKRKDQMWLYGIHVTIEKAESVDSQDRFANFPNIQKILKDSDRMFKEKSIRCKLLQLYDSFLDSSKTQLKGPDHEIPVETFESEYHAQQSPLSAGAKSASECLTEMLPGFSVSAKEKPAIEDEATDTNNTGCSKEMDVSLKLPHVIDALKNHFDQRFSEYERQMAVIVEEKLMELERKQNEKLDLIIRSLQDLKSSLNIRGPEE
ncbi:hypothetical protein B7P43_G01798 [Cryptotermes secundus]|uniref:Uncharacterized protein n=1 Tax=Cryptotermes secundus TaxID=105785 RepID=A0A2J7QK10_9NEOP|nr:hypothetical protein B7P43_G01798 [Cryptotermes secundus]